MSLDTSFKARLEAKRENKKQKIKVGFTKWQYETVHAFLEQMRESGQVEAELGGPISITIDWSDQNDERRPHIFFQGTKAHKSVPIKDILEAVHERN